MSYQNFILLIVLIARVFQSVILENENEKNRTFIGLLVVFKVEACWTVSACGVFFCTVIAYESFAFVT